jgi:hypothetical protein
MPLVQFIEVQSPFAPHGLPVLHVDEHTGFWHTPPVQILEPQSAAAPHGFPLLQAGAQPPVGSEHFPFAQLRDPQSPLTPQ